MGKNVVWHPTSISKEDRQRLNHHKSAVLWFTGLSGSGKSTIANKVEECLFNLGKRSYILDGDNIRHGINSDLGFSDRDRVENIRRIGEISRLFVDSGQIVLTAFISPFRDDREMVRELFSEGEFIEIYVKCPIEVCEIRDPKGLYKKARAGEICNFTGIDSVYEVPLNPEIIINTNELSMVEAVDRIVDYLKEKKII
ncbi:adenylylsulfate kinase [Evansella vedderi]|uniref:Adenylyl-sulfate kinase n=1 Tax=Evansella vedderi TaxID=38282 RepID=A0ABU0A3J1_9BACI|nr:adenylyl-sulfate kinase [Evansella vedderi]MDQ0258049.1 adenylylsulfate kinase [Evansella vedderi]